MLFSKQRSVFKATLSSDTLHNQTVRSKLNESVHGRFYAATPLALPCFSSYNGEPVAVDSAACSTIQNNYTSALFRTDLFDGYMNFQDEMCASSAGDGFLLDNQHATNPLAYSNESCNQRSVLDHYIDVQELNDIVEAFQFAKKTGIKLSIKNGGSANSGRNNLNGSLGLWVRNLKIISYDQNLIPEGCGRANAAEMVMTVRVGVNTREVMQSVSTYSFTYVGAYIVVVGASGG